MIRPVSDVHLLGYRIERDDGKRTGRVSTGLPGDGGPRCVEGYVVLAPDSEAVLGRYPHLAEAERAVIGFELAGWRDAAA